MEGEAYSTTVSERQARKAFTVAQLSIFSNEGTTGDAMALTPACDGTNGYAESMS